VLHLLLYEFTTGGGFFSLPANPQPAGSLLGEGLAMASALAEDLQTLERTCVTVFRDTRLPDWSPGGCRVVDVSSADDEREALRRYAAEADGVIVIAPEFDGLLLNRSRAVQELGGRLLSPDADFIRLTSDKHATADQLACCGLPVPYGQAWDHRGSLPRDFPYPAVVKPGDGAGSAGLQRLDSANSCLERSSLGRSPRLEAFCRGMPASVAFLCGPGGRYPLPACQQRLSGDGTFAYLGGKCPLEPPLAGRAERLAREAMDALPETVGYVGVDLVLGDDPLGRDDVIIEVNPRLTTSYVGLRHLTRGNLAAAMLSVAQGSVPELSFDGSSVTFDADGAVRVRELAT
jgi:hypothetical protein